MNNIASSFWLQITKSNSQCPNTMGSQPGDFSWSLKSSCRVFVVCMGGQTRLSPLKGTVCHLILFSSKCFCCGFSPVKPQLSCLQLVWHLIHMLHSRWLATPLFSFVYLKRSWQLVLHISKTT